MVQVSEFDKRLAIRQLVVAATTLLAMAGHALAQGSCPTSWVGMPDSRIDSDIAVGSSHVLLMDHDHIKLFDKCGNNVPFIIPSGPVTLPNGLPLNGTEAGSQGFFYTAASWCEANDANLADGRVIYDSVTRRYVAMAAKVSYNGVVLAVSEMNDPQRWPVIVNHLIGPANEVCEPDPSDPPATASRIDIY